MKTLIGFVILSLVLFFYYIRRLERKTLFVPSKHISFIPSEIGLRYEDVYFRTRDKLQLNGWFIPAKDARATLLFIHGNAGNIGDRMDKLKYFNEMGINVFIFDYRGYGKSSGRPTETGLYTDAEAAYEYLTVTKGIVPDKIVVYGASLGGAVAIDLVSKQKVAGLIVDSSFSCAADMAKIIYPFIPTFLISVKMDSVSKIRHIAVPKLFIHSKDDDVVPYALGRKLYAAAMPPKFFVDIAGDHNNGYIISEQRFIHAIKMFLNKIFS